MEEQKDSFWADLAAERVIKEKGNKSKYTCASGITPSGIIHIGNFREIMTTELVKRALEKKKKKVRFIYSWDDYDRFRKVPDNVSKDFEKYIGMSVSDTPDPFKCHKSYAEHFEKELEISIKDLVSDIEFIRQNENYKKSLYAEKIKEALIHRKKIAEILNKFREEPLDSKWIPLTVYCEKCKKDDTEVINYDEKYTVEYKCKCSFSDKIDFRKKGIVKLPWRVDWPMRWVFEQVDFEPGGKDHSTVGGSFDTAKHIVKELWKRDAPTYQVYDFVTVKGQGGKMSKSIGNVVRITDLLEIYEPEIVRWFYASNRPNSEFAVSFDLDVIKVYEDFDKCERVFYNKEEIKERETEKQKRIYESSVIKLSKTMQKQVPFRHLTVLVQVHEGNIENATSDYKSARVKKRAECAWNWIQNYAPDEMKFKIHENIPADIEKKLDKKQKESLNILQKSLEKKNHNEESLFTEFKSICEKIEIQPQEFFKGAYLAIIGKEKGPKLAGFIVAAGRKRIASLLAQI